MTPSSSFLLQLAAHLLRKPVHTSKSQRLEIEQVLAERAESTDWASWICGFVRAGLEPPLFFRNLTELPG